jgi:hypothetical protein
MRTSTESSSASARARGWRAVGASVLMPGLGQWLQGRRAPAVAMFVAALLLWIVWLGWLVHLWSALDADWHAQPG